jgi:hypothetical protein
VRTAVVVLTVSLALAGLVPESARAHDWAYGACGLPAGGTLYAEYAEIAVSKPIREEVFVQARPPLVLATSGRALAETFRAAGAHTIFWQMQLQRMVGLTTTPADPATVPDAAVRLHNRAVAETGCATPLIALNELQGGRLPTPWAERNAQYRANVLVALRVLHERGSRPFLLVPTTPAPFVASPEAEEWWRSAAAVSDIVLQMHFNGRRLHERGPRVGSRTRRIAMRRALDRFIEIGIPSARLGLLHGFQSGVGYGGREQLPLSDWLRVVKWEALAGKQVVAERAAAGAPLGSVWSWGWGDFPALSSIDPDKHVTACVYLWARDPALCDGPGRAATQGRAFQTSLTEGQIQLAPGIHCSIRSPAGRILSTDVERLAAAGANGPFGPVGRGSALAALLARHVERRRAGVRPEEVARAEQALVAASFGGDWSAYGEALARHAVTPEVAREFVADQLRRRRLGAILGKRQTARQWSVEAQKRAYATTTCLGDELQRIGVVDLAAFVPVLRLPASVSGRGARP